MSTIRFELHFLQEREKTPPSKVLSIRLVYQISRQKRNLKTGQRVPLENWNQDEQRAVYIRNGSLRKSDIDEINRELAAQEKMIRDIEKRFELDHVQYDIDMVTDAIINPQTKVGKASKELYAFIDDFIKSHSDTRKKGSLIVYASVKWHLEQYQKKNKANIGFAKIDNLFFQSFRNYLSGPTINRRGKIVRLN